MPGEGRQDLEKASSHTTVAPPLNSVIVLILSFLQRSIISSPFSHIAILSKMF